MVSPNTCASCDEPAPARVLFCPSCAATVTRAVAPGAVFGYGAAIAMAIIRMKFRNRPDVGHRLGRAMDVEADVDLVVPVPLHPKRLAERGYNQAALLAAPVAKRLRVPLAPRAVDRIRDTPRQMELAQSQRIANVAGAFSCKIHGLVAGRRILLVDDVTTTGATLASCAEALRQGGAARVTTVALSRRERD